MGMFGDKQGDSWWQAFRSPLTCEAFGNKQTHCKLLRDNLVTSCKLLMDTLYAHCKIYFGNKKAIGWFQSRSNITSRDPHTIFFFILLFYSQIRFLTSHYSLNTYAALRAWLETQLTSNLPYTTESTRVRKSWRTKTIEQRRLIDDRVRLY